MHEGRVPLVRVHVYGEMPPLALSCAEYADPTLPAPSDVVVMDGFAGTVIVTEEVFELSATEVAMIVAVAELAAGAGAVYVAEVAV